MELDRLLEIVDSDDPVNLVHNQSPVRIEAVNGNSAVIKYLNSERRATVPIVELFEADLPDLEDEYPTGLISRISPVIRA